MNKKILFSILSSLVILPTVAMAAVSCGDTTGGNATLEKVGQNVTNAALTVGAALAVIGFIVAGILYLTAGGGERLGIAKKALIAAVIGTALIALAGGANIIKDIFCKLITT